MITSRISFSRSMPTVLLSGKTRFEPVTAADGGRVGTGISIRFGGVAVTEGLPWTTGVVGIAEPVTFGAGKVCTAIGTLLGVGVVCDTCNPSSVVAAITVLTPSSCGTACWDCIFNCSCGATGFATIGPLGGMT